MGFLLGRGTKWVSNDVLLLLGSIVNLKVLSLCCGEREVPSLQEVHSEIDSEAQVKERIEAVLLNQSKA